MTGLEVAPLITAIGTVAGGGAGIAAATKSPPKPGPQMPPAQNLIANLNQIAQQQPQIPVQPLPQNPQQSLAQLLKGGL